MFSFTKILIFSHSINKLYYFNCSNIYTCYWSLILFVFFFWKMVSEENQTNPDLQLPIKKRYLKNYHTQQPDPASSSSGLFIKMTGESFSTGLRDRVLFRFQWDGEDSPRSHKAHLKTRPVPCILHWPERKKYRKLILFLQL